MADPILSVSPARSGLAGLLANLAHLAGGKAGAGLISLVYLVIAARTLGAIDYGVLVLVHGYVTLVGGLIAFSGWHGIVRYGGEAIERHDHSRFLRLVRFVAVVELGFGAIAILVAAALAPLVGPRLGWPPSTVVVAISYSFAVIATVRATPQGILQIAGRFDLIGAHQLISPGVRLAGATIVWLSGGGLSGFLVAWLAAAILEGVSMWYLGLRELRRMRLRGGLRGRMNGVLAENAGLARFVFATNIDITLRELAPNLTPLTIGWFLGPAAAGLFALAQRASSVLQQPATLLSQASYAVLAKLVAADDGKGLRETVWRSAALSATVTLPILLVLGLFSDAIIGLLGGHTFAGGAALLMFVAVGRAFALPSAPAASALTALGRAGTSAWINIAVNLGTYPLLPLLILWVGLDGAGWHVLLQGVLTAALAFYYFQRAAKSLS